MDFNRLASLDPYQRFRVTDSREEDYKHTAEVLSDNFYAQLLVKLQKALANTKKAKEFSGTIESKVLGNTLQLN